MGSNPIGSIALPDDHLAGPCPTTRHRGKPAERAARCRSRSAWPHAADQGARGRTLPIKQVLANPLLGTASRANIWEPLGVVVPVVSLIAPRTHVHP